MQQSTNHRGCSAAQGPSASELMSLQRLLADRADLWRGRVEANALADGLGTGFAELDQSLPWGGWPTDGLTELLTDQPAAGLALILPALTRLCAKRGHWPRAQPDQSTEPPAGSLGRGQAPSVPLRQGWLLFVNPPLIPYAPALAAQGLDLERLVLVDAPAQGAWVMEQGLRLGGCAAVVAWTAGEFGRDDGRRQDAAWTTPVLRRLQLAAKSRSTPALLMRPSGAAEQSSPALLRLDCETSTEGLQVSLRKLRGGRPGQRLSLSASSPKDAMLRPPAPQVAAQYRSPSC